jgi:hypothetical protein
MAGTRRKPGRMGPYIEGFRARLMELGYTPASVHHVLTHWWAISVGGWTPRT